jgi:retron-type reverse transcriptase
MRPLGVPSMVERLSTKVIKILLEEPYESDMWGTAQLGYRKGQSITKLFHKLKDKLNEYNTAYELDFKNYFGSLSHKEIQKRIRKT